MTNQEEPTPNAATPTQQPEGRAFYSFLPGGQKCFTVSHDEVNCMVLMTLCSKIALKQKTKIHLKQWQSSEENLSKYITHMAHTVAYC